MAETMRIPNNRYINFMVRCPCLTAIISLVLCLVTVAISVRIIISEGSDIIADSTAQDINDIRSKQRSAYEEAVRQGELLMEGKVTEECASDGPRGSRPCDTTTYAPLTLDGQVVLTVFSATNEVNVFTSTSLTVMKAVEDKIVTHQNHSDFCKRRDPTGVEQDCQPVLSPLSLFYANMPANTTVQQIVQTIDAIDGNTDGVLTAMTTAGLSDGLGEMRGKIEEIAEGMAMGNLPAGTITLVCTSSIAPGGATPQQFAMALQRREAQDCLVDMAAATLGAPNATSTIYKAMLPFTNALRGRRGDTQQDVNSVLLLSAYMQNVGFYSSHVDYYFDQGFSVSNLKSRYSRGAIWYGAPLPGFRNPDDRPDEQRTKFTDWFTDEFSDFLKDTGNLGEVEVLFFATPLIRTEFLAIIMGDSMRVLLSLVLVFVWIWLQTNSCVIAAAGALEIVLSIPLAFFFYYAVFQFRYFDGLNFMTLFIVVAIGADDIFVFMDQYKQSAYYREVCVDLRSRMNWVYGRAAWAMFITSATTCAAFVCTAVNPLPNIQSFGIFSAFVIIADYILVITWFPACVVLYHNYLENRPCCFCCPRCKEMWPCQRSMETSTARVVNAGPDAQPEKRCLEKLIGVYFAGFVKRFAIPIVIFFVVLLIPAGILAGGIQPLSRSEEMLPPDHPFQRLWTISGEEFPSSSQTPNTPVHVVWGVEDMDMSEVSILFNGPKDQGVLRWDNTFKFDEDAQRHIWAVCEEVRAMEVAGFETFISRDQDTLGNPGDVDCPLFDWKMYLESNNQTWPLHLEEVGAVMPDFLASVALDRFGRNTTMKEKWSRQLVFDATTGQVRLVIVQVASQLMSRAAHPSARLKEHYQLFEDWMVAINGGRLTPPATANKAFQTADGDFNGPNWVWMNTQDVFKRSAVMGAVIGTILAFVVILFATQQIIIAFASFITIAAVLATVLACMKIASFELGSTASICITILAGFAVDYVVHLAHAFNHAKSSTRVEKFQEAFDDIGVSVLSGMVTSVLAGIVLLLCVLQFFSKFGFFLLCTVIWAWVWGNFFFMGLMKLIGPDQGTHWILQLPHSVLPEWPFGKKAKQEEACDYVVPGAASENKEVSP